MGTSTSLSAVAPAPVMARQRWRRGAVSAHQLWLLGIVTFLQGLPEVRALFRAASISYGDTGHGDLHHVFTVACGVARSKQVVARELEEPVGTGHFGSLAKREVKPWIAGSALR
jgi:hypothetical protein